MLGAYLSLNGAVASAAFCFLGKAPVPKTVGAAKIAAPVAVAFFKKSLLE
jgi:hypothetical protein